MKNKLSFFASLACLAVLGGCDKHFEEINTDPTKLTPANMNYNYLFTAAELVTSGNSDANAYEDWRNNLIYGATMMQHLSSTVGYWQGDKYTYNPGYNSAYWDVNYPNSVKNITDVLANIKADPKLANFYQITRIFRVFMFQRLTDMYGDIPYSEAGLGYISGNTQPKYDKQQDIYANMLKELDEAATALSTTAGNTVGAADIIYAGDPAKWKKFAYSEMLRLAMRMSKVDPNTAKTWAAKAFAGGVITANADNALLQHPNLAPQNNRSNGTGSVLIAQDPTASRVSKTFVDYLKSNGDPRLHLIATVSANPGSATDLGDTTSASQVGQPNGYDAGGTRPITSASNWPGDQNKYSIVNRYTYARFDAPTFFLTAAESQLLLAEAAERTWIAGSAATFYNAGVTAAMDQFSQFNNGRISGVNIPASQINAYLAAHPYSSATGYQMINEQYWAATFMDEYEAWANWRRSAFPALTPSGNYPGNVTGGTIPRRFTYPLNEAAVNPANYSDAIGRLSGGDKMTSRVWWDK
jgi:hypothetical protein